MSYVITYILSDQKEICLVFNKHFAAGCHLFNVYTGPTPMNSAFLYPVNHTSVFTLQPISPWDVANSLQLIPGSLLKQTNSIHSF